MKRVKIAHSFLQSVSNQFARYHFKLANVILQMAVKEFFEKPTSKHRDSTNHWRGKTSETLANK